jgi:hypothetical protein
MKQGNEIGGSPFKTDSALICQKKCQEFPECKLFNWNQKSKNCFLRTDLPVGKDSFVNSPMAIVGARDCSNFEIIWPEVYPPPTLTTTIGTTTTTTTGTTTATTTTGTPTTTTERTTTSISTGTGTTTTGTITTTQSEETINERYCVNM